MRLPLVLHPDMLIAQVSFQSMFSSAKRPYQGRYQGDTTVSASRYRQPIEC